MGLVVSLYALGKKKGILARDKERYAGVEMLPVSKEQESVIKGDDAVDIPLTLD